MTTHPLLATLADVERFEAVPFAERYPVASGVELLRLAGDEFGDDPALQFLLTATENESPDVVSYRQLAQRITQTANALHGLGVGSTDTVTMLLTNVLQTWYCVWGAQAAGIANPVNPMLEAGHIAEIMKTAGAKVMVVLAPLRDNPAYWHKVNAVVNNVPSLQTLLVVTVDGYTADGPGSLDSQIDVADFNTLIADQPADFLINGRTFNADDVAAYFHTGGTTGRPKIARITHGGIAFIAKLCREISAYRGRYVCLSALPLFHIYGLISAGIGANISGRSLVMMTPDGFRHPNVVKNWWHHAARFRVEAFSVVPTVLSALLYTPPGDNDLSHLKDVGCGAAPLPKQLQNDFQDTFHVRVTNGYGMTETTCLISRAMPENPPPQGSVGARIPYSQVRIVHLDDGEVVKECAANETGILITRGPHIFKGYLDPEDDAGAWVTNEAYDDWFITGDLAFMDEAGFIFVTGRAKDLIIRGGHNIDPVLIEEPLSRHPAVAEAAAIGQPDPYAGEVPVAYVRLRKGVDNVDSAELSAWCAGHISEQAAIPKRIEILPSMPVTAAGKIFKQGLVNRATETALAECLRESGHSAQVRAYYDPRRGQVAEVTQAAPENAQAIAALLGTFPLSIDMQVPETHGDTDR